MTTFFPHQAPAVKHPEDVVHLGGEVPHEHFGTRIDRERTGEREQVRGFCGNPHCPGEGHASSRKRCSFRVSRLHAADSPDHKGAFYPYHRWLIYNFEDEIQQCGYVGGLPYWDWTLDAASEDEFPNSPIFDATTGFGGSGQQAADNGLARAPTMLFVPQIDLANRSGGGCIMDGPFAGLKTQLGPGDNIEKKGEHCVTRELTYSYLLQGATAANLSWAMTLPDYGWFNNATEVSYHASGHWSVGGMYGTMTDMWASGRSPKDSQQEQDAMLTKCAIAALDPLFYLHHVNVDRAWWSWQSRDLAIREFDISGPLVAGDYRNEQGGNITLDARIHIGVTRELEVAVSDVMHIQKRVLCYTFDQLY